MVSEVGFRLAGQGTLLLGGFPLGRDEVLAGEVGSEVLEYEAAFGEHKGFVGGIRGLDGHDGGFSQGMDLFEFGRGEHVLVAVVDLDLVVEVEFFEEPDETLGARFIEPFVGVS